MRSYNHIRERDAVLLATDALTNAILGDAWTLDAHMAIKGRLLDIIDGDGRRVVRILTHERQVAIYGWCYCEYNEGNDELFTDCPEQGDDQ